MTPTPNFRPYTISVDKKTHWALRVASKGLIGDGQVRPETTPDGIAVTLLTQAIEAKWPGLLAGYKKREDVDALYVNAVAFSNLCASEAAKANAKGKNP